MFCKLISNLLPSNVLIMNTNKIDKIILSSLLFFILQKNIILATGVFYTGLSIQSLPLSLLTLGLKIGFNLNTSTLIIPICFVAILFNIVVYTQV